MCRYDSAISRLCSISLLFLALIAVSVLQLPARGEEPEVAVDNDGADEPMAAQEESRDDVTTVKLGLGALAVPDFEGAKDHSVFPIPIVEISNWHRFSLSFRGLSYRLYQYQNDAESEFKKVEFRLEPTLGPSASREEDNEFLFFTRGDSKYLRGLGDIDTGLDVGANLFLRTGPIATQLRLKKEVAGGHDGFTANLGVGTRIPFTPRTRLGMELATTWANDTYMDRFFSIDHRQAYRSIYHRYDADSGFKDGSFGMRLDHDFTDRVSLLALAQYTRLFGDAADSPIVEGPGGSRDQFTVMLGLTYKWTF